MITILSGCLASKDSSNPVVLDPGRVEDYLGAFPFSSPSFFGDDEYVISSH